MHFGVHLLLTTSQTRHGDEDDTIVNTNAHYTNVFSLLLFILLLPGLFSLNPMMYIFLFYQIQWRMETPNVKPNSHCILPYFYHVSWFQYLMIIFIVYHHICRHSFHSHYISSYFLIDMDILSSWEDKYCCIAQKNNDKCPNVDMHHTYYLSL